MDMTHNEFISILKRPETVAASHLADLKEVVDAYPYFAPGRLFFAKALQKSGSLHFGANLKFSSIYATNRRWLYYYIYPEKNVNVESVKKEKVVKSGDYFDMINSVESSGGDSRQSLRNLAERLKSARALVESPSRRSKSQPVVETPLVINEYKLEALLSPPVEIIEPPKVVASEDRAKILIKERKYEEALVILNELNLNNPKKSIYFADQIRFLEKVIANTKK
jgi:hypothetical protein